MIKREKFISWAVVALLLAFLLTGCSGQTVPTTDTIPDQYSGAVSYLGPEGTYTQEALKCFFGAEGDYRPQKTVADAVRQILEGNCTYAVIPQENTIGGPVYDYVDELLSHDDLQIIGEVELPIRQALLVREGCTLGQITTVYSHKQGIAQSRDWLSEHLPQAKIIEVSSTAEGARMVTESEKADCAAVASVGAAEVYGLTVLEENIQQNDKNQTRFFILSAGKADKTATGERMVFSAEGSAKDLPKLIAQLEKAGMTLVGIHDRPAKTTLGSYIYLIECKNQGWETYEKITKLSAFRFRYYGAFSGPKAR